MKKIIPSLLKLPSRGLDPQILSGNVPDAPSSLCYPFSGAPTGAAEEKIDGKIKRVKNPESVISIIQIPPIITNEEYDLAYRYLQRVMTSFIC
jgi:hypothetical protein